MPKKFGGSIMDQTTASLRNGTMLTPIVAFTLLLAVGTGGQYTPAYHVARSEKFVFGKPNDSTTQQRHTIAGEIEYIKGTLNLTMSELARCLHVSRQAPYNWISGGTIKVENRTKLDELRSAADVIAAANLPEHALLFRRKLPGGKTLLETVSAGGSGIDAAGALIKMFRAETEERAALSRMLASRQPAAKS
jgi:hypothetical protein